MTLRQGTVTRTEQDSNVGTGPRVAYLMDHPTDAGWYVFGVGNKVGEATAFLKDNGSGWFIFDDDPAEEDRVFYLVGTNEVIG